MPTVRVVDSDPSLAPLMHLGSWQSGNQAPNRAIFHIKRFAFHSISHFSEHATEADVVLNPDGRDTDAATISISRRTRAR